MEDVAMRTPYDFAPLSRSSIGFDRLFDLINNTQRMPQEDHPYPPYDIARTGDDSYRITLAVPGLPPAQIEIVLHQNQLTVTGKASELNGCQHLHQGIPARGFERKFSLADYVEVEGAAFDNGLLHIDLVRRIPEAMKPRRITIGEGSAVKNGKSR
jgi:molecular chaperone IbpA